jgi:16S rRNA (guanine966-N2)-methyltransferase
MRIIAGAKKGMALACPRTLETRPITDRIKESLFNVLASYDLLAESVVADLFCGVGSLGLEALSRGAVFATFVENSPKILPSLEKNIAKAGYAGQSKVLRSDAFRAGAPGRQHTLVFVDPPYATTHQAGEASPLASLFMVLGRQVVPRGVVVVRTEREVDVPDRLAGFQMADKRLWGSMAIRLFQNVGRAAAHAPEESCEDARPAEDE